MKRCPPVLLGGNEQIRTTIWRPTGMSNIKQPDHPKCWWGRGTAGTQPYTSGANVKWVQPLWKGLVSEFNTLTHTVIRLSKSVLSSFYRRHENVSLQTDLHRNVHTGLIYNRQKNSKHLSTGECRNKFWSSTLQLKEPTTRSDMAGSRKHAGQKERHIEK